MPADEPVTSPHNPPMPLALPPLPPKSDWTAKQECPQRDHKVPLCPGNIYGERCHSTKQVQNVEHISKWKELTGGVPPRSPSPEPNVPGAMPPAPESPDSENEIEHITQEGEVDLINYLCTKAIPDDSAAKEHHE